MHHIVVMGVSGSGKTTLAHGIADAMGWPFAEGDDFHPQANRDKMASGIPLTDEDRWPWLRTVAAWIGAREVAGESTVITCSALKRAYRDLLREGHRHLRFLEVTAPAALIAGRLETRTGHFMPPSLLNSQLAALEPLAEDEPGLMVSAEGSPDAVLHRTLAALGLSPAA